MTSKDDILRMARQAGILVPAYRDHIEHLERFAELARADERKQVAAWMMQRGYATGHGDTTEDLLQELEWQVAEREREACAKVCEELFADVSPYSAPDCAAAIRARNDK